MKPADLIARQSTTPLLVELDLTHGVREAPPSTPLEAAQYRHVPVLRTLVEGLRKAAVDDKVAGLVAHVGGRELTLAQASEIRSAVAAFRESGKPAVCWTETFGEMTPGNIAYHLASSFGEVWLQPTGDLGLIGVVGQALFVRDALDKLGISMQVRQRHEFKTAANTFLEQQMTGPHREMLERLVSSAMDTVVADIADARGLQPAAVRSAVDHAPLLPEEARERGLIDRIGYRDEVYDDLRSRLGEVSLRYLTRYGKGVGSAAAALPEIGDAVARVRAGQNPREALTKPVVAVVQATGSIHLGRSGRSPFGGTSIGSETLAAALRSVGSNEHVKAVVLRVDSPGGSAAASDAIRRAVLMLRRTGRPVVASMGSVAGSGGYYISMGADAVVASSGTLTGSIGVLGGKQVVREALGKLGVARESVAVGTYADMFSNDRPFTDDELSRLDRWLDRVDDDFTSKAAADRNMTVTDLHAVAKGRVWTGADARECGLVDELGGLERAVDLACDRAGVTRDEVAVKAMPKLTPLDRLRPAESSDSPAATSGRLGLERALAAVGLAPLGVLSMPLVYQFH